MTEVTLRLARLAAGGSALAGYGVAGEARVTDDHHDDAEGYNSRSSRPETTPEQAAENDVDDDQQKYAANVPLPLLLTVYPVTGVREDFPHGVSKHRGRAN